MTTGRNPKNNADYFSHDADASSDEKIVYLESKFGHTGYAVYFKLLECMTRAENFKLAWDEIKQSVYASKFGVSVTEIQQIVTECCRDEIKAFVSEGGFLYSPGLLRRFEPLIQKREYNRQKYQEQKQLDSVSATETANSVTKKTQSKVKESKVKNKDIVDSDESTGEEIYYTYKKRKLSGKRLESFKRFWEAFDYKDGKAKAADSWFDIPKLTESFVDEIVSAAKAEAARRPGLISSGKTPKMAQGWITERRWEDETYKKEPGRKPQPSLQEQIS